MQITKNKSPLLIFLGWTFFIAGIGYLINIGFEKTGVSNSSIGGIISTIVGMFVITPSPLYGAFIASKHLKRIRGSKEFVGLIFKIENKGRTIIITAAFCMAILLVAILAGTRTEMPLYLFIPAIPLMILGGGIEEVGWRGFLQPELEKRYPFAIATLITTAFWLIWHLPLWLLSSSNQSTYDIFPYILQLAANAFALAAIYRLTKSTFACIMYHAWGNAIGAIYEWKLFATFPIHNLLIVYYIIVIAVSIVISTVPNRINVLKK